MAGDTISVSARIARQEIAQLRIVEPLRGIMVIIAFCRWPLQKKMERLDGCFSFEDAEASFAADAPKTRHGLSGFPAVRRFSGPWTGLDERKIRLLLTIAP